MTPDPLALALVALFGALGAVARHLIAGAIARRIPHDLPWGTIVVNISGAAAIGAAAAVLLDPVPGGAPPPLAWIAVAVGFLGGYTTVSAFALQTFALLRTGAPGGALLNLGISLVGAVAAAALACEATARFLGG